MNIIVAFSWEDSSILTSYIIDVEIISNYSLNVIISSGPIPCFRVVSIMLYIWRVIISINTISDFGWSRNGSHKLFANKNLHAFFGWTVTDIFF